AAATLIIAATSDCGGQSASAPSRPSQLTPVVASSEWPAAAPETQGVNGQSILDLVTRIVRGDYGSVTSLLIVRHGQLVVEEYFGWSSSRAHTLQSVTKSVTSLLTGVAGDNRKVAVTDRAVSFFPDYEP